MREDAEGLAPEAGDRSGESDPTDPVTVWCPYCGEPVEMLLDAGGGPAQRYVEDCEVCCRPWSVEAVLGSDASWAVTLRTQDDG